jgi:hypothetical protein
MTLFDRDYERELRRRLRRALLLLALCALPLAALAAAGAWLLFR